MYTLVGKKVIYIIIMPASLTFYVFWTFNLLGHVCVYTCLLKLLQTGGARVNKSSRRRISLFLHLFLPETGPLVFFTLASARAFASLV